MTRRCHLPALALVLVFGLTACSRGPSVRHYPHYDLAVTVDPDTREIAVTGSVTLPAGADTLKSFHFYLQRDLTLEQFTIDGDPVAVPDTAASDSRFMPQARKIHITLPDRDRTDVPLRIEVAYSGKLGRLPGSYANQIEPEWTELGMYYPWFPYNGDLFRLFTFDVVVDRVEGYAIFGIGSRKEMKEKVRLHSSIPTNGIVVCLSGDVNQYTAALKNGTLRVYHHQLPDTLLADLSGEVADMMHAFSGWFGEKNSDITLISTRRSGGGGYARVGGVVLAGISSDAYYGNRQGYTRYFSHELAHLWWFRAAVTTWQDWLNEGLAEYSALLFMRSVYGDSVYQARLLQKKETLAGTPPIWDFARNSAPYEEAYKVLYSKAPVLLAELEQKMGKDAFLGLCVTLAQMEKLTTETFLAALARAEGDETASWFATMLKTR